jgi:hypothetical protein
MMGPVLIFQKGESMGDLFSALLTGMAIFALSILTGIILYFLFKDVVKRILDKNE